MKLGKTGRRAGLALGGLAALAVVLPLLDALDERFRVGRIYERLAAISERGDWSDGEARWVLGASDYLMKMQISSGEWVDPELLALNRRALAQLSVSSNGSS